MTGRSIALASLAYLLAACSALDLFPGPIDVPCANDEACSMLATGACVAARCDALAGYCVVVDRDADDDGAAPLDCAASAHDLPATDCDDDDAFLHAGAAEVCDLRDDDCDGAIDEGCAPVRSLAVGIAHSCALRGGDVFCWGASPGSGPGPAASVSARPRRISGVDDAIAIAAAFTSSCALESEGRVLCWSTPDLGPVPQGAESGVPIEVALPGPARSIAMGAQSACAILDDASVWCWSSPNGLALALGRPVDVPFLLDERGDVVAVSLGLHVCVLRSGGEVSCAGANLGYVVAPSPEVGGFQSLTPREDLPPIVQIVAGVSTTCALDGEGAIWCWGGDILGVLGTGAGGVSIATRAMGFPPAASFEFAQARSDNAVLCSRSLAGERTCVGTLLGNTVPGPFLPFAAAEGLAIGLDHACAWWPGGPVRCLGLNALGMLGDGTDEDSAFPIEVRGL